jgi:hypothetical protein
MYLDFHKKCPLFLFNIVTDMTITRQRFGKHRLKTVLVEPKRTFIAEQRFGNHVPTATDTLIKGKALPWI